MYEKKRRMSVNKARQIDRTERDAAEKLFKKMSIEHREEIKERTRVFGATRTLQVPDTLHFKERKNAIRLKKSSRPSPGTHPKSMSHTVSWFKEFEAPKGVGRELDGTISLWFHGEKT